MATRKNRRPHRSPMSHAAQNVNPQQPPYRDRKRYAWILSLLVPCLVGFGPLLMVTTGDVRACGWFLHQPGP
jgi:hypothetical protein